jgi:hypothetical protein
MEMDAVIVMLANKWCPKQYRVQAIRSSRRRLQVSFEMAQVSPSYDDPDGSCCNIVLNG